MENFEAAISDLAEAVTLLIDDDGESELYERWSYFLQYAIFKSGRFDEKIKGKNCINVSEVCWSSNQAVTRNENIKKKVIRKVATPLYF